MDNRLALTYLRAILRPSPRPLSPRLLKPQSQLQLRPQSRPFSHTLPKPKAAPRRVSAADDPNWISSIDAPPRIVSTRKKHKPLGLLILALIPITSFVLGTWQVRRLSEKTELVATLEDRLVREPLPLPPRLDPDVIPQFNYRRVTAKGVYQHGREMLLGPRTYEGKDGYFVITPLERGKGASTILVNRGWISRNKRYQVDRAEGLPRGEIEVLGLLREPWKRNYFTPDNRPDLAEWYFPDVEGMARHAGAEGVWVEETWSPTLLEVYSRQAKGVPIGKMAELNIHNNHVQYIFTWYALSFATSIMLWMVLKKAPTDISRKVRTSREW